MSALLKSIIAIVVAAAVIGAFVLLGDKSQIKTQTSVGYTQYTNPSPKTDTDGLCISQVAFPNTAGNACNVTTCSGETSNGGEVTNNMAFAECGGVKSADDFNCLVSACGPVDGGENKWLYCSASYSTSNEACTVDCPGIDNDVSVNMTSTEFDNISNDCNSLGVGTGSAAQCIAGKCSTFNSSSTSGTDNQPILAPGTQTGDGKETETNPSR